MFHQFCVYTFIGNDDGAELTKNEVLIGMLNSIINPCLLEHPPAMHFVHLREKFERIYGQPFEKLSSVKLDSFIERNKEWFEKYPVNQKMMVKQIIRHKKRKKSKETQQQCLSYDTQDSVEELSEAETEYLPADTASDVDLSFQHNSFASQISSDHDMSFFSGAEIAKHDANDSDDTASWTEVKKKVKPKRRCIGKGNEETTQTELHEDENIVLLKSLFDKENGDNVIFCKSFALYENSPCQLMLDLVSMWNTPGRMRSHIVVGVDANSNPKRLIGLSQSLPVDWIRKLFNAKSFTTVPVHRYFDVRMGGKLFGIIEVSSSFGAGLPSVTQENCLHSDDSKCFLVNQLWYIEKRERKPLLLSDHNVAMIYQWFSGRSEGVRKVKEEETSTRQKRTEKRNGSTSMTCVSETSGEGHDEKDKSSTSDLVNISPQERLLKALSRFRKGRHVLVTGDLPNDAKEIEAISLVPWLAVFDFDIQSRDSGLLNANETFISKRRSLRIVSWSTPLTGISENATIWSFPRGRRDDPQSRLKIEDENDQRKWLKKTKLGIDNHIEQLQRFIEDYTVLTILVLWPKDEKIAPFICKFLERIDENVDPSPQLVLCLEDEPRTDIGKSVFKMMCNEQGDNLEVVRLNYTDTFLCIKNEMKDRSKIERIEYQLPTADSSNSPSFNEREIAWLREDFDVLYLDNPYSKLQIDFDALKEETDAFYRGGTLHWFAWYECGAGHFDVERDIVRSLTQCIQKHLDNHKSGIVYLYHAPGSGGSTLAQRIVWDFHTKTPAAHVKLRSSLPAQELVSKVEMIYERTHKPVLLLLDGEDESKVKFLMRNLQARCRALILYVKRFPYSTENIKDSKSTRCVYLGGTVSREEANRLALKFRDRCSNDSGKMKNLDMLSKNVAAGEKHYLYEFGLATYLHDYKGLESYVKGYLKIEEPSGKMKPWQQCLGFLSLVNFYGQTSLPMQFFAKMFHLPPNYFMEMSDFPHPIRQFVVKDCNENKTNNIRICHYLIAKEILEYLLGKSTDTAERDTKISFNARKRLGELCKDLIEYSKRKTVKSSTICHVLTRTFIFRDNKDMGENAEQTGKKPILSKLMSDIPSNPPLFTERLQILEKLTEAFPNDANFYAHLGRFYSICRPDDEDKAEECFNKALELCERQTSGKKRDELDEKLLLSLMHIYHMYGNILQKRIACFTGLSPTDEPEKAFADFEHCIAELIQLAKVSCKYFRKCRQFTPPGHESCFGYVGEIVVRLQLCDFVHRQYKDGDSNGIKGYIVKTDNTECRDFIRKSIYKIDNLLLECYNNFEDDDLDRSIKRHIFWYNYLFHRHSQSLEDIAVGEDVNAYRLRISAKKLKYGKNERNLTLIDNISSKEDIEETIDLYENIFREIHSSGMMGSKAALARDYQEWLHAIRHPLTDRLYTVEDVLLNVRRWNDVVPSPMSKFYRFVLTSIVGFGQNNTNGKTDSLLEAQQLRTELKTESKFVIRPRYPREWLGINGGIRCVGSGTRFISHMIDDRNVQIKDNHLRTCKGTISRPNNKKLSGQIDLDLGNNVVPVKVFYIPLMAKLAGEVYVATRVEFVLAFSLHHGYEAFNVKKLTKYGCVGPRCTGKIEIASNSEQEKCQKCGRMITRDAMRAVD